jgi:hypothetical protein
LAGQGQPLPAAYRAIIAQSERRVLKGEQVPVGEKLVSLFEPHADIIVKGGRDTGYGALKPTGRSDGGYSRECDSR